jgi:hypothetical protein
MKERKSAMKLPKQGQSLRTAMEIVKEDNTKPSFQRHRGKLAKLTNVRVKRTFPQRQD